MADISKLIAEAIQQPGSSVGDYAAPPPGQGTLSGPAVTPNFNPVNMGGLGMGSIEPSLPAQKQAEVAQAGAQKRAELGMNGPTLDQMYQAAAAITHHTGQHANMDPMIADYTAMDPYAFLMKYGTRGANAAALGAWAQEKLRGDETVNRGLPDIAGDSALSAGDGLAQTLGAIPTLAIGAIDPQTGVQLSDGQRRMSQALQSYQSGGMQAARRAFTTRDQLDLGENAYQYQQDKANGDGDFLAGLKRIGRDVMTTGRDTLASPDMLEDSGANAAGGLLALGPLGEGFGGAGRLALGGERALAGMRAAALLDEATGTMSLARVAAPAAEYAAQHGGIIAATGATMGGSAYQEAVNDAMDQLANRSDLTDAQKADMANRAGLIAAAAQGSLAAATAGISAKFHENPLALVDAKTAALNTGKATLEMGLQSASGALANNEALRLSGVNPNQDLTEGVGGAIGSGVLNAVTTAGAMQLPGVAGHGLAGAVEGAKVAGKAAGAALDSRVNGVLDKVNARSPVAPDKVQAGLDQAHETLSNVAPPEPAAHSNESAPVDHMGELIKAVRFDPAEEADRMTTPAMKEAIGGAETRVDAADRVHKVLSDPKATVEERTEALRYMQDTYHQNKAALETHLPEVLKALPEGHPDVEALHNVGRGLADFNDYLSGDEKTVAQSNRVIGEMAKAQPKEITEDDLHTPKGKQHVDNVVRLADYAPQKVDPQLAGQILEHAEKGRLNLTPEQKGVLQSAKAFTEANQAKIQEAKALGIKTSTLVSHEIQTEGGDRGMSAKEHLQGIYQAVKSGDTKLASARLERFMQFAQSLNNKVESLNHSLSVGGTNDRNAAKYEALNTDTGQWYEGQHWFNPIRPGSVETAQKLVLDAKATTSLANSIADAFPHLGVDKVKPAELSDPKLMEQPAKDVAARYDADPNFKALRQTATAQESPAGQRREVAPEVEKVEPSQGESQQDPEEVPVKEGSAESSESSKPETAIEAAYPDLVGTTEGHAENWFTKAFSLPEEPKSRLVALGNNLAGEVMKALQNVAVFREWVQNDSVTRRLGGEASSAYQVLLGDHLIGMEQTIDARLQEMLGKAYGGTTFEQSLKGETAYKKDGSEAGAANRLPRGKVLNLTVVGADGQIHYSDELLQSALLAGMQWLISSGNAARDLDEQDVADILGKDVGDVTQDDKDTLNLGRSRDDAVQSLSAQIARFWGVDADQSVPEGYTKGIPEGMAKEVLTALQAQGLVAFHDRVIEDAQGIPKKYPRVESLLDNKTRVDADGKEIPPVVDEKTLEGIRSFPTALEHLALTDPEEIRYIGEAPKYEARTQLRNKAVENTPQQMAVLKNVQNTPHWLNLHNVQFAENLGADKLLLLFGKGDPNTEGWNTNYRDSVEGYNRTVSGAFEALQGLRDDLDGRSDAADQTPIYYRFNFNRVNRLQMEGSYNPQASKLMREWVLPTRSTLDLTGDDHQSRFMLAAAQAWGIKVHKDGLVVSTQKATALAQGRLKPAIDLLQSHLQDQSKPLTEADVHTLKDAFGGDLSPVAMHAALEYARFLNASPEERKAFTTHLYVEADGVTDGVVNALQHYTTGRFDAHWVQLMAKGGLYFNPGMTLAKYIASGDTADLYQAANVGFRAQMAEARKAASGPVADHIDTMLRVFERLLPNVNFDGKTLTLDRGVVKNPMTVTVYGSGEAGIASKIAGEVLTNLYELISKNPEQANSIARDLEDLVNTRVKRGDDGLYLNKEKGNARFSFGKDPAADERFTMRPEQVKAISDTIRHLFVGPMRQAIDGEVGGVNSQVLAVRKAVQVMSIFQHHAFLKGYEERLAWREANDPTWKKGDGLSQQEQDEILRKTMPLGPLVETGTQNIYPAGSANSEAKGGELSRGVLDDMSTPNYIYGPVNAGVRGIAFLNIAPGDGQMIQNILTSPRAPKGGLPVYDGFHMKLDTLHEDAAAINEAVRQGWLANPLEAVRQSYETFLAHADFDALPKEGWAEVAKALGIEEGFPENGVRDLHEDLARMSEEAAIRHEVLSRVASSTDHMAGAESPHQAQGVDASGEHDEAARKLNEVYDQVKAERDAAKEQAQAQEPAAPAEAPKAPAGESLQKVGAPDPKTGARVVTVSGLSRLADQLKLPEAHRPLVNELIKGLQDTGYRLVMGTPEQIRDWAQANGKRLLGDDQADGDVVHGYTVLGDRMIYLNNPSSETLVHELIHAATMEKVFKFYDNPRQLTMDQRRAVKRLEVLMNEWRGQTDHSSQAYQDALATVEGHLNNTDASEAVRKASALNEFMAWNLSNQDLVDKGQQTRVNSDWRKWGRRILQAIKNLVWSKPEGVPKNLYAALRFDTSVLLDGPPAIQSQLEETRLFHSTQYGTDDRLDAQNDGFNRLIAANVRSQPNEVAMDQEQQRVLYDALEKSTEIIRHFQDAGFRFNQQQMDTMHALVGAFSVGTQLDPVALARIDELHRHAVEQLDPAHFMADPDHAEQPEQERANQMLQAVVGNGLLLRDREGNLLLKDSKDRSLLMPAFLALASVSDEMRSALSQIEMPKTVKTDAKTVDGWAEDLGVSAMEGLSKRLTKEGNQPHVQAALDVLTNRLADSAQSKRDYIADNTTVASRFVSDVNDKLVSLIQLASGKAYSALDEAQQRSSNPAMRGIYEAGKLMTAIVSEKDSQHAADGVVSMMNRANVPEFLSSFVNDLIGRTSSNANVYDMIKEVRTFVSRIRQQFREHLPQLFAEKFKNGLADEDSTHLFKAMGKTDLALLRTSMSSEQVLDLLKNPEQVKSLIAQHEAMVRQLAPNSDAELILQKASQLARFMNTGEHGKNLLSNAWSIADLNGERARDKSGVRPSDHLIKAIDRLATLYAMDGLSDETKERVSTLAQHEPEGVNFMLDYLAGQRKDEQAKVLTEAARINHYKGYIPSEGQEGLNMVVADDRDHAKMVTRGYRRVGDYKGSRAELGKPSRGYYFSSLGQSAFDQGILQNVRQTASGVDPARGYSYGSVRTAGRITDQETVRAITENLKHDNGSEPLRAIYDGKGKAVAYERMIDPSQEIRLNRSTDLAKMIGVWRGRQAEEAMAGHFNNRLIDALHDTWTKDMRSGKSDREFVNLLETHKLDPVTKDAVSLFTPDTLAYVQKAFEGKGFFVRKDLLQDAIGYRQASVRDAWTGTTRWSPEHAEGFKRIAMAAFGADAYSTMVKAEKFYQGVIGRVKDNIIVKSVVVPVTNIMANMYQLSARGVPLKAMINGAQTKTSEIQGYVNRSLRTIDLEAELRASSNDIIKTRKIQAELQTIQDTDRRMSIWPLIQAGEFSTVAEDVTNTDAPLFSGKLQEHITNLVNGMPEALRTAGRYALVTHDTALYKGLEKSVAYGDFVAKAILYDDLTKRQNMDSQTALARVAEEFVNYDRLTGRSRSYAERMGLLWFWNYKVRTVKVAVSMLRHNPLQTLLTSLVPTPPLIGDVGLPIADNFLSVAADGRLIHSIGPGMGLYGFSLNPWINLFNSVH